MNLEISIQESSGNYEEDKKRIASDWKIREFEIKNENEARDVFCHYHFSPHEWKDGYRCGRNFIKSHFICADADEGLSLDQVKERLKMYQYIIVTSKNHQKAKNDKPACGDRLAVIPGVEVVRLSGWEYLQKRLRPISEFAESLSNFH